MKLKDGTKKFVYAVPSEGKAVAGIKLKIEVGGQKVALQVEVDPPLITPGQKITVSIEE